MGDFIPHRPFMNVPWQVATAGCDLIGLWATWRVAHEPVRPNPSQTSDLGVGLEETPHGADRRRHIFGRGDGVAESNAHAVPFEPVVVA